MEELEQRWVGGICIHENKILLIHRINKERDFNQEYFVFPGNHVDDDKSLEKTLIMEFEQAGIIVQVGDLFYTKKDSVDESEYYYLCDYKSGEPAATKLTDTKDGEQLQFYTPLWIPLEELDELVLYPESVKNSVLETIEETLTLEAGNTDTAMLQ
jgi:ADP-ribose pyrophosphatase YjhB (NUDIX family)